MRALVTGAAGFIGSHVVDKLSELGVAVRMFDQRQPSHRDDLDFYRGSILDLDDLSAALSGVDAVFHLAAIADVKDVYREPHHAEAVNVRGTANVLEAMRRSGVRRLVFASTIWVYSDVSADAVDEETPLQPPAHLYTATKIASEYYCHAYSKLYGIEYAIMRLGIPYGPRARPAAVIPIFVEKALRGEPLTIAGDGSQHRRFVYVEDLAEGLALGLKPIAKNKVYNLAGKQEISMLQVVETISKLLGKKLSIEHVPVRPGDFSGKDVSSLRAETELGWEARINFEEGVRRYVEWHIEQEKLRAEIWDRVDPSLIE